MLTLATTGTWAVTGTSLGRTRQTRRGYPRLDEGTVILLRVTHHHTADGSVSRRETGGVVARARSRASENRGAAARTQRDAGAPDSGSARTDRARPRSARSPPGQAAVPAHSATGGRAPKLRLSSASVCFCYGVC